MIHIAVLLKLYLDLIRSGRKTIECRLTRQARDPYERIEPGERIYFKQSAGPYGAMALAEHVIFEDGLTSRRVTEIRRDYNDQICGDATFWNYKRHSEFCTLIWLRDVKATDAGPHIRPLQGVAWLCLDQEPAWRRVENINCARSVFDNCARSDYPAATSFFVNVTAGNLRNNSLYITRVIDQFPETAQGGANRRSPGKPVTLILHDGPTVRTDIVAPRNLLRTRVWGTWFRRHGVRAGDRVVFTPVDNETYLVGLARGRPA